LIAKNHDATIIFNEIREDELTINRISKHLETQNKLKIEQLKAVLDYCNEKKNCNNKTLMRYFGEILKEDCGICTNCLNKNKILENPKTVSEKIITLLMEQDLNSREIENLTKLPKDDVIFALQNMLENNIISLKADNLYTLIK
jgi:ATP-dependent DNA helicase RecQ